MHAMSDDVRATARDNRPSADCAEVAPTQDMLTRCLTSSGSSNRAIYPMSSGVSSGGGIASPSPALAGEGWGEGGAAQRIERRGCSGPHPDPLRFGRGGTRWCSAAVAGGWRPGFRSYPRCQRSVYASPVTLDRGQRSPIHIGSYSANDKAEVAGPAPAPAFAL